MRKKIIFLILMILININVYAENEATIKNVKVNGRECKCNGYECSIEVDASSATITYELNDKDATVDRLSGFNVSLNSQNTLIKIIVTNDKGQEKIENTYNINISLHEKSSDYSLNSLKVNGKSIEIIEGANVYAYDANYTDEIIKIEAEPNDANAKIDIKDEYLFPLDASSTTADFFVTSEDGEEHTYRIVVRRNAKPDTKLKNIVIDKGNIDFKSDVFEYKFNVEYSVNKLEIEATPENKKAKVEINNKELSVGENEIKIFVTLDKLKSEYTLLVTREENMDKSLANLKSLEVKEYPKLNFEENVLDYVLKFSEIPEKLTISAKAIDSDANIDILYNEDLENDSKVVVKVSLNDNKITREYSLRIVKNEGVSSNKTFIVISIIILVITIIILFILEVKERKNVRKNKLNKIKELKKKKDSEKKEKVVKKKETVKEEIIDDIEII